MILKTKIRQLAPSTKTALLVVLAAKLLVLSIGYSVTYVNGGTGALVNTFYRWDATNYVNLAKNGYVNTGDDANLIVFFPLYPLLIRLITFDFAYTNLSALLVTNIASLIACLYLYKLAKLEFNDNVALKAVLFFCVFPVAYFLSVPYTEGVFFALVISSFYYARVGRWSISGGLCFFASLTRLAGLLMLPTLLLEYYHQIGWRPKKTRFDVVFVFLALAGFLVYLGLNYTVTGSPFTFVSVEATHWYNAFDPQKGFSTAGFWMTHKVFADNLTMGLAPILFAAFGALMIGLAVWKRLRPVYILYMFLCWVLAVSTSLWMSVPRYIFAMFPMFMALGALTNNKALNAAAAVFSAGWLCFFTVLFALGYWAF